MASLIARPIQEVDIDQSKLGWEAVYHDDLFIGLRNPRVGSFMLHAMMKDGQYLYDFPVHEDGPLDENGIATPGVVVVPIRTLNGVLTARSVVEWRPAIRDHLSGKRGVEITGLPGGMAKKVGQTGAEAAFSQAMAELGIRIISLDQIGLASANRAYGSTIIKYYAATYELAGGTNPEAYESILGSTEFPLHEFPLGLDGIINTAIAFAWRHFSLVHPHSTTVE